MSDVGSGNYILLYSGPTATFLPSQRSRAQAHACPCARMGLSMYRVMLVTFTRLFYCLFQSKYILVTFTFRPRLFYVCVVYVIH